MCLTGVDYFSTLGYQPGIAFLAAGLLSPLATLILVILTLVGALPIYSRVATESPHGQGSISMLEDLLPRWRGKALVLCLLGFAATDFIITITLSAADATAHIVENPLLPHWLENHRVGLTLLLIALLGGIFLKGFREAIGVAVFLVFTYLVLNSVVVAVGIYHIFQHPDTLSTWKTGLFTQHSSALSMIGASLLLFPKLALGLSGFETGVAVMPLVRGDERDTHDAPAGRIRGTRLLLRTAALIMSVLLICSSLVTTLLIAPALFQKGGQANGRALAYLAHSYLGGGFGTVYDLSTISILWFAGASAMAGLLNLVPRYLPRYGMAPEWAKASRPLVVFFTAVGFVVTILFDADVDAQGGAYATGVLVLMTSAALAVTLSVWQGSWLRRLAFLFITLVFGYTTGQNIHERPEGIKIASFFIGTILVTSLVSRALRSTELRIQKVVLDDVAQRFVKESGKESLRIIAHRPGGTTYERKEKEAREAHNIPDGQLIFLEIKPGDASEFTDDVLEVRGVQNGRYRVLQCESPAVPNAIAALLLHLRDRTHQQPHIYFGWTEGNPITYMLKYLAFGEGDTAPVTREVLRQAESDPKRRPRVHVG
ncbi:MAG: amino acid transporter [Acidobacteriota bacterium]